MYRRYRSVHMECSQAGAPAMVARALVGSLYCGPLGTPAPVNRLELKDENVDLGWYRQTITKIQATVKIESGVPEAKAPKREPGVMDTEQPQTSSALVPYRAPDETEAQASSERPKALPMPKQAGAPITQQRGTEPILALETRADTSLSKRIQEAIPAVTIRPVQQVCPPTSLPKRVIRIPEPRPKPAKRTAKQLKPVTIPPLLKQRYDYILGKDLP